MCVGPSVLNIVLRLFPFLGIVHISSLSSVHIYRLDLFCFWNVMSVLIVSLHFSYWLTRSLLSVFHISLSVLKFPSVVLFSSALWTVPFHFIQHFTKCLQIFSKLYINPSSGTLSVNYLSFSLWIIWVWAKIKSLKWDICSSSVLGLIFCFNNWSFYLNIFSPFCRFSVLHGLCCLSLNSDFMLFTLGLFLPWVPELSWYTPSVVMLVDLCVGGQHTCGP